MKKVIIIVGMPGSGKTFCAKLIAKKYKGKMITSGDIIRDEVKRRGLKYTPKNDKKIAQWFHAYGRHALIVQKIFEKIKRSKKKLIVIEGLRNVDQLEILEDLLNHKVSVIKVSCHFMTRYKRAMKRGRFGKEKTKNYIKKRDANEKKRGVGRLIRKAKHEIDNNGTKKDLEVSITRLMKRLR